MNEHKVEDLRTHVFEALRETFDSQLAQLAGGRTLDAQRLIETAKVLLQLMPAAPSTPEPAAEYTGAKQRLLALIGDRPPARETELAAEVDTLRAEVARLTDELERLRQAATVQPEPKKASPSSKSAPEKWKAPESWTKAEQLRTDPEPWREWSDLSMRRIRHSDWGPI